VFSDCCLLIYIAGWGEADYLFRKVLLLAFLCFFEKYAGFDNHIQNYRSFDFPSLQADCGEAIHTPFVI
jgi:hypothetical protein